MGSCLNGVGWDEVVRVIFRFILIRRTVQLLHSLFDFRRSKIEKVLKVQALQFEAGKIRGTVHRCGRAGIFIIVF